MTTTIDMKGLGSLVTTDRTAIAKRWPEISGKAMPEKLRLEIAAPWFAYQVQEKQFGRLAAKWNRQLAVMAAEPRRGRNNRAALQVQAAAGELKRGTRLVRTWRGTTYQVTVTDAGFEWGGQLFPNLSVVATAITGMHRSGPAFFGLNRISKSLKLKKKAPRG